MDPSPEFQALLYDVTYHVVFHLRKAFTALGQRDSYLYWPFVVSTLGIALAVWRVTRTPWRVVREHAFSARLWWHRSARADYKMYFFNALLVPLVTGALLMSEEKLLAWLGAGAPPAAEPAAMWARVLFTLAFFVAYDFGRFVAHCLLHDVPALWEFHKVHHAAEVLTPMTSFRVHPVELLLFAWGGLIPTALVAWLFQLASPGSITVYTFLGLHVILWAFNLIGNLRHSHVWLSYGRLGRWLISPAQHQLHHSREPQHLGCNRGFELAIWDRLYGTLYVPGFKPESFRLGFDGLEEARYHSLLGMYVLPFVCAGRRLAAALRRPSSKAGEPSL